VFLSLRAMNSQIDSSTGDSLLAGVLSEIFDGTEFEGHGEDIYGAIYKHLEQHWGASEDKRRT
jgi:hypothetical protein